MGILLPPVSQVTNTRINLTQHHRNRSLDSALQRIPEVGQPCPASCLYRYLNRRLSQVEVSSPNTESENVLCTNSILGTAMCSKVASSTNPNNTPTIAPLQSNVTIGTYPTRTMDKPLMQLQPNFPNQGAKESDSVAKKREDLTSLGSDDSGIICSSETEQSSLTRIRRSRESLDSGEIDPEEECIEIIEITSTDEEDKTAPSDLAYASADDSREAAAAERATAKSENSLANNERFHCRGPNVGRLARLMEKRNQTICVPIEFEEASPSGNDSTSAPITPIDSIANCAASKTLTEALVKTEHNKNDVIFKNIFGATKNAIFRTAQSIIENHEKKNAQRNRTDPLAAADAEPGNAKSPTEVMRKKDFFTLKTGSSKSKVSPETPPEVETLKHAPPRAVTTLTFTAKDKEKVRLPGMVKCFVRSSNEGDDAATISLPRSESGHSGLLRFFESPIFNIHFALHYLFYSKEPGVLSFIGNKIFSFKDHDVDLYIPQLILMYIQMDELAEVLDPYLVYRCRRAADFSLKCSWLLEAYNYNADMFLQRSSSRKSLIKELYPKRERRQLQLHQPHADDSPSEHSPVKKTHHRSQSDATGLLNAPSPLAPKLFQTPVRLCLGDLSTGRAFDNGCTCFESVRGTVNDLLGHRTVCVCGAPKLIAEREFMRSLIDIGRDLTPLPSKTEKTSILRMRLNLINKNLPARVWLPLNSDIPHHVVRITEEKTAVLNSKDKTPYIIYVEVVEVTDIYTSPVIPKLMPSLRHTKSEEYLDLNMTQASDPNNESCEHPVKPSFSSYDMCRFWPEHGISDDDAWFPEDDEISAQYIRMHKKFDRDAISQMSVDSVDSREHSKFEGDVPLASGNNSPVCRLWTPASVQHR